MFSTTTSRAVYEFFKIFYFFGLIISFGNVRGGLTKNVENFMNSSKLNNFNFTNFNLNDNNQLQALAQIGQTFVNNSFWQMQIGLALSTGTAFFCMPLLLTAVQRIILKAQLRMLYPISSYPPELLPFIQH